MNCFTAYRSVIICGAGLLLLSGCTYSADSFFSHEPDRGVSDRQLESDGRSDGEQNESLSHDDASMGTPEIATDHSIVPENRIPTFDIADAQAIQPLKFQAGDTAKVSVWGYPELDHVTNVHANGTITVPLVGEIRAESLTVEQVRKEISAGLKPFQEVSTPALRTGDSLTMVVWPNHELNNRSVIEPTGMVTFPLVGSVRAAGIELDAIQAEVSKRLGGFIRDAEVTLLPTYANRRVLQDHHVSVLPLTVQPRRVALIGEVGVQGLTEISGSLSLVEALAQAQLLRKTAALNSIIVIRDSMTDHPAYQQIRLGDFFDGKAPDQNIYLQNGDVVIVPKTFITKAGDFVELFFARTLPVFSWWTALHQASSAKESADTVELVNDSLKEQLDIITINP
jgi:polysaccharide export outer membrane protein